MLATNKEEGDGAMTMEMERAPENNEVPATCIGPDYEVHRAKLLLHCDSITVNFHWVLLRLKTLFQARLF